MDSLLIIMLSDLFVLLILFLITAIMLSRKSVKKPSKFSSAKEKEDIKKIKAHINDSID